MQQGTGNGNKIRKEGWKSTHEIRDRRKAIMAKRKALIEAGFDDKRISEVIAVTVDLRPATIMTRIKDQVRKGRMERNPNNNKEESAAKIEKKAKCTVTAAQPTKKASIIEEIIAKLDNARKDFELLIQKAREDMHRHGR